MVGVGVVGKVEESELLLGEAAPQGQDDFINQYQHFASLAQDMYAAREWLRVHWRCTVTQKDCVVVGPQTRCICGHSYRAHAWTEVATKRVKCRVGGCRCRCFSYFPIPEQHYQECNLSEPIPVPVVCDCGHGLDSHLTDDGRRSACRICGQAECNAFRTKWQCRCGHRWGDHRTFIETAAERTESGRDIPPLDDWVGDKPHIVVVCGGEVEQGAIMGNLPRPLHVSAIPKSEPPSNAGAALPRSAQSAPSTPSRAGRRSLEATFTRTESARPRGYRGQRALSAEDTERGAAGGSSRRSNSTRPHTAATSLQRSLPAALSRALSAPTNNHLRGNAATPHQVELLANSLSAARLEIHSDRLRRPPPSPKSPSSGFSARPQTTRPGHAARSLAAGLATRPPKEAMRPQTAATATSTSLINPLLSAEASQDRVGRSRSATRPPLVARRPR